MYRRILVPTDGSPCAQKAVEEALRLAKATGGEVTFLHVVENPSTLVPTPALPDALNYELAKNLERLADEALEAALKQAREAGVSARAQLRRGDDVGYEIAEAAGEFDAVVMATHGRGLRRFFMGSVTQGVLARCPVPVLVIRCPVE